jgi:hypothetical protein
MVEMIRDKGENEFKYLTDEGRHGAESSFCHVWAMWWQWSGGSIGPRYIAGLIGCDVASIMNDDIYTNSPMLR